MALSNNALVTLNQVKSFLNIDPDASLQVLAEYVGTGNGTNVTFTLDHAPLEGTLKVYVDSVLKTLTTDYSYSTTTLTFTSVGKPGNGAVVTAAYDYAPSANTFESYDDDILELMIEAATKKCEDFTERAFVTRSISETHVGDGTRWLRFYKRPVTVATSVILDDVLITDYSERLSIGRLYRDLRWTQDSIIELVYSAGYGADRATVQPLVPEAVTAVLTAIANWYENRLGVSTQSISGVGSANYDQGLPEASKKLLGALKV